MNQASHRHHRTPPKPPPTAIRPATVQANPHTMTPRPHQASRFRQSARHRVSKSSQTDARNNHREISACPHIRNTTEPTHTTLTDAANPTTRMRRHTNHDTSDDKLWPSTTNHHGPYPPVCTTQHISQQTLLPRPATIVTRMTPHTQRDASHIQSPPTRRYVSESSHSRPPDLLHRTRTRAHLDDIHHGSDSASADAENTVSVGRRLHRQHG